MSGVVDTSEVEERNICEHCVGEDHLRAEIQRSRRPERPSRYGADEAAQRVARRKQLWSAATNGQQALAWGSSMISDRLPHLVRSASLPDSS
jgi:hypothetical protein